MPKWETTWFSMNINHICRSHAEVVRFCLHYIIYLKGHRTHVLKKDGAKRKAGVDFSWTDDELQRLLEVSLNFKCKCEFQGESWQMTSYRQQIWTDDELHPGQTTNYSVSLKSYWILKASASFREKVGNRKGLNVDIFWISC